MGCCSTVCGLWSSRLGKGHLLLFFLPISRLTSPAHNMRLYLGWVLSSYASKQRYHGQAPCSFISSVSVSDCVGVSGAGDPLLSLTLLSLLPTHCLSADVARGRCGPWLSGPCACICVSRWPLPSQRRYRWDLRLSVSARAARRRRKQDARGSTVISQRALFHTIPGRSLYSLHAGRHWTFTCANNHTATGPLR